MSDDLYLTYFAYCHDRGTVVEVHDDHCVHCNVRVTTTECDNDEVMWLKSSMFFDGHSPLHRACRDAYRSVVTSY